MCNLCSGRLFLVPNPCCCCELRCGVIWAGFGDIILGLVSLYFPMTFNIHIKKNDLGDETVVLNNAQPRQDEPVFDIDILNLKGTNLIPHCYMLQILSGILVICAAYGMGSHNFSRFLLGCTWMLFRCLIVLFLIVLIRHMLNSPHGPLKRYGIFASIHVAVDVYLFIVVRYYTMECYDAYRYQRIVTSTRIRRLPPTVTKTAPKTRSGKGRQKKKAKIGARKSEVRPVRKSKNFEQVKDMFQKQLETEVNINKELERVPVWDRKNEIIFYGEDYTEWDPAVFQARWEMLNEKPKPTKSKMTKSKVASVALSLMKSQPNKEVKDDNTESTPNGPTTSTEPAKHSVISIMSPKGNPDASETETGRTGTKKSRVNLRKKDSKNAFK